MNAPCRSRRGQMIWSLCRRRGWGRGRAPKLRPVYSPGRDACPPIWEVFPAGAVNTTPSKLFIWVDGDDLFGSEIIDTIDTFQADESASAPPAK